MEQRTIYIAEFEDGFRICTREVTPEVIEEIQQNPDSLYIRKMFGESPRYITQSAIASSAIVVAENHRRITGELCAVVYLGKLTMPAEEKKMPVMIEVRSEFIESIGFDAAYDTLYVKMKVGDVYTYDQFSAYDFIDFLQSESKGRHYNQVIKKGWKQSNV